MKGLVAFFLLSALNSSMAFANYYQCFNPTTGAEFELPTNSSFTMNATLISVLKKQTTDELITSGQGLTQPHDGSLSFYAGAPKGWILKLVGDSGGMMLTYLTYAEYQNGGRGSHFYFNPGECHFP